MAGEGGTRYFHKYGKKRTTWGFDGGDERVKVSLPEDHGASMRAIFKKGQFRIKIIFRIKGVAIFSSNWLSDLGDIMLEYCSFVQEDQIRRVVHQEVFE